MSKSLYWRIVKNGTQIGGSQIMEIMYQTRYIGPSDIPYLRGMKDSGVDGAKELIEAIEQHGEIELFIS